LCLVLSFFIGGLLLISIGAEFLGLIVLIVYVGAIAVLFLFVVMMLNINTELREEDSSLFIVGSGVALLAISGVF
jgi:NADH-quinone oxidoreductase subunit J